ncbi:hypothetical protein ACWEOZ_20745 [Actinoplanes sp. NPDC004185]
MTLTDAPGGHAPVTFDSGRDAGWRSVVLQRVTNERTAAGRDVSTVPGGSE